MQWNKNNQNLTDHKIINIPDAVVDTITPACRWAAASVLHEVTMCESCKEFPKMCNAFGVKQHELCIIIRIQ